MRGQILVGPFLELLCYVLRALHASFRGGCFKLTDSFSSGGAGGAVGKQ